MMTNKEIKKALEKCVDIHCNSCPYADNYSDCTNRLKDDARSLIIKQEQEIARLNEVIKNYKEVLCETTQRKDDAIKLNDKLIDEYEIKVKQAKIDVLNKLKDYVNQLACDEYGDSACDTNYITIDIDKYEQDIDEMIAEVQNGGDKC